MKPAIEILCDGNSKVGYGHIRRSMTLARELGELGFDVRVDGLSDEARRFLPEPRALHEAPRVTIFDSLEDISAPITAHRQMGRFVLALDCFSKEAPDVNVAVYPHTEVRAKREAFVGFEYILIRPEIRSLKTKKFEVEKGRVVIVLGGGDLLQQGHRAAQLLSQAGCKVTLVQGPLAKATEASSAYEVVINPSDLPERMAKAEWLVTNGGGCLFEAIFLEKPVYVLPQTEAEVKIAKTLDTRHALLGIGIEALSPFSSSQLESVRQNCSGIIDGRGAERISSIVEALV